MRIESGGLIVAREDTGNLLIFFEGEEMMGLRINKEEEKRLKKFL
jgi:hypothetical protein